MSLATTTPDTSTRKARPRGGDIGGHHGQRALVDEQGPESHADQQHPDDHPDQIEAGPLGRGQGHAGRRHQRQGLGRALVSDAARRTLQAAEAIGGRALVVHAANQAATAFYSALGFDEFPTDPLHLGILLKDLRRRYDR